MGPYCALLGALWGRFGASWWVLGRTMHQKLRNTKKAKRQEAAQGPKRVVRPPDLGGVYAEDLKKTRKTKKTENAKQTQKMTSKSRRQLVDLGGD